MRTHWGAPSQRIGAQISTNLVRKAFGMGTPGFFGSVFGIGNKKKSSCELLFYQLDYVVREASIITISAFHTFTFTTIDSFVLLVFGDGEGDNSIVILLEGLDKCIVELIIHKRT
jgi:hypothetical protein